MYMTDGVRAKLCLNRSRVLSFRDDSYAYISLHYNILWAILPLTDYKRMFIKSLCCERGDICKYIFNRVVEIHTLHQRC